MILIHSLSDINFPSVVLWFAVGFFVGLGWCVAGWLASKASK